MLIASRYILRPVSLLCTFLTVFLGISQGARAQLLTGYDDDPYDVVRSSGVAPVVVEAPRADVASAAIETADVVHEPAPILASLSDPAPIQQQPVRSPVIAPAAVASTGGRSGGMLTGYGTYYDDFPDVSEAPSFAADRNVSAAASNSAENEPVDLQADNLEYNEQTQTITASGNVMMVQAGRILRADTISYHLDRDTAYAKGNVVLNEETGDIYLSDEVEFNDQLKNGFVEGLTAYMADGARFTADAGRREEGNRTIMERAGYTPCEVCMSNPDKPPVWQIKAAEVTHNEEEKTISYKHARFEAFGIPIGYTPYFSHSDGSVKRKSGLLGPMAGYRSRLGAFAGQSYYVAIAPDMDATVGVVAMTTENPMLHGEWRQRWDEAQLLVNGGVTYSGRSDRSGGVRQDHDEELRGHVSADGRWDMNEKWRSGLKVEWASDDQYIRQYDFVDFGFEDNTVLESQIYAERFSGRDYASGRLIKFQDMRVRERQEDQPEVLPEIIASFKGDPNSVPFLKGRWGLDASFLGLQRAGSGQDMNRFGLDASWYRRFVSDYGLLTRVETSLRGDVYNTRDRDVAVAGTDQGNSTTETRLFSNLHVRSSYPVVRQFENSQAVIEPVVALTLASHVKDNNDIPNEDSRDVQLDASNVFEPNRFPGTDRVEDESHVAYGVRTGLYDHNGNHADVFLGQSTRIESDRNRFPAGSGLNERKSDIVGQVSAQYQGRFGLDYRFQLDSDDLVSRRHEVYGYGGWDRFRLSGRYLYAQALGGTDIVEAREQVQGGAAYYVTPEWRVRSGATQDLGYESGLRQAYVGIDYFGQCLFLSLTGVRNLTSVSSGESETEVMFRIGLKNMGGFETSGYRGSDL